MADNLLRRTLVALADANVRFVVCGGVACADRMPDRGTVDPLFDGHLERPLLALSAEERLDWLWEMMELVRLARPAGAGTDADGHPKER